MDHKDRLEVRTRDRGVDDQMMLRSFCEAAKALWGTVVWKGSPYEVMTLFFVLVKMEYK